jgi:hypothetical protein
MDAATETHQHIDSSCTLNVAPCTYIETKHTRENIIWADGRAGADDSYCANSVPVHVPACGIVSKHAALATTTDRPWMERS